MARREKSETEPPSVSPYPETAKLPFVDNLGDVRAILECYGAPVMLGLSGSFLSQSHY